MNRIIHIFSIGALSSVLLTGSSAAQSSADMGFPIVQYFRAHEYRAHPENWSIVTDPRGVLYVANEAGILEFDGSEWRLIKMPFGRRPRALDVDVNGNVYVGAIADFGMLSPDTTGTLAYRSLLTRVDMEERRFLAIENVHVLNDYVFFLSASRLYRWDGNNVKTWTALTPFQRSFVIRDTLYVAQWGRGLLRMDGDSLVILPGGDRMARTEVRLLLPADNGALLVLDGQKNVYRYDGSEFRVDENFGRDLLGRDEFLTGIGLGENLYAIGTQRSGLVLLDSDGGLVRTFSIENGLPYGAVKSIHRDSDGGFWLALDNGIARVDPSTSLTSFSEASGLIGSIQSVVRRAGDLFVASDSGVYELLPAVFGRPARFSRLSEINTPASDLLSTARGLFVGTTVGVFNIADSVRLVSPATGVRVMIQSKIDSSLFFLGGSAGLFRLRSLAEDSTWETGRSLAGSPLDVRAMIEDRSGTLWLGLSPSGIARVLWPSADSLGGESALYDSRQNVPPGPVRPLLVTDRAVFATRSGLVRYDEKSNTFLRDDLLSDFLPEFTSDLKYVAEDFRGSVWLFSGSSSGRLVRDLKGSYSWQDLPALNRIAGRSINTFMCESAGGEALTCWIGTDLGLFRFDPDAGSFRSRPSQALIRRVTAGGFPYYGGAPGVTALSALPYRRNDLVFEYAVPDNLAIDVGVFQSYLEGDDNAWSDWSSVTKRSFTNLKEGRYVFHVRARSTIGGVSSEGVFVFEIAPPWQRTWWAYGLYLLGLILSIVLLGNFVARLHVSALKSSNRSLATELSAKTDSVEAQRRQLAAQNKDLLKQNRKVEFQKRELAKRNDELRYRQERSDEQDHLLSTQNIEINKRRKESEAQRAMLENVNLQLAQQKEESERLANEAEGAKGAFLANTSRDILELSKIESGKISVHFHAFDARSVFEEMGRVFAHRVDEKRLDFVVDVDPDFPARIVLEEHLLRQILINLLSNAIMFTDRGQVRLAAKAFDRTAHGSAQTSVRIEIRETGIPEDQIDKIFGAFEQRAGPGAMKYGPTGLSLSITKRLVELMGGTIKVACAPGQGSTFVIEFSQVEFRETDEHRRGLTEDTDLTSIQFLPARILVVDDVAANRELINGYLSPFNLSLEEASGVREAIARATTRAPSVILLGLKRPYLKGLEAAREIKGTEGLKNVPLIVISASEIRDEADEAMKYMDGFVPKPVSRDTLVAELMKFLPQRFVWTTEDKTAENRPGSAPTGLT